MLIEVKKNLNNNQAQEVQFKIIKAIMKLINKVKNLKVVLVFTKNRYNNISQGNH